MTAIYDIGDMVRVGNYSTATDSIQGVAAAAFANLAGTATDPTAVTLVVERPDLTTLVYGWPSAGANGTLIKESTGRFYFDVTLDQAGRWSYRLAGTGAVAAAAETSFYVRPRRVPT